jgi:hypothetical protein
MMAPTGLWGKKWEEATGGRNGAARVEREQNTGGAEDTREHAALFINVCSSLLFSLPQLPALKKADEFSGSINDGH